MKSLTESEAIAVKDVLTEWADDKGEVIFDAYNYDMSRRQVKTLGAQLNEAAKILEKLGDKDAVENYSISPEHIDEIMNGLK